MFDCPISLAALSRYDEPAAVEICLWTVYAWMLSDDEAAGLRSLLKDDSPLNVPAVSEAYAIMELAAYRCGPQRPCEVAAIAVWAETYLESIATAESIREYAKALTPSDLCAAPTPAAGCCRAHVAQENIRTAQFAKDRAWADRNFELRTRRVFCGATPFDEYIFAVFPSGSIFPMAPSLKPPSPPDELTQRSDMTPGILRLIREGCAAWAAWLTDS